MADSDSSINQQNILLAIGRLEGKIDLIISALATHVADDKKSFSDDDDRLTALENKQWFLQGIAAAVGAVAGFIGSGLGSKLLALL